MDNAPRTKPLLLLVDDDKNFTEIATTQLKAAGFDLETAHTSEEALQKAPRINPDLILLDIYLSPSSRGTDTAFTLKADPKTQNVRIVFLSSMKDPWPGIVGEKRDVSRDLGMEDFIDKTEDFSAIAEKIRKILSRPVSTPPPVVSAIPATMTSTPTSPTTPPSAPALARSPQAPVPPPPPPPPSR